MDQTVKNLLSGPEKNRLYYDVIITTREEMYAQNILSNVSTEEPCEVTPEVTSEDQSQFEEVTEKRTKKKSKKLTPNEEAAQKRKL